MKKVSLMIVAVVLLSVLAAIPVSSGSFRSPESTPIVVTPIQPPTKTPTPTATLPYKNYIPQVLGNYDFSATPTPTPRPTLAWNE